MLEMISVWVACNSAAGIKPKLKMKPRELNLQRGESSRQSRI